MTSPGRVDQSAAAGICPLKTHVFSVAAPSVLIFLLVHGDSPSSTGLPAGFLSPPFLVTSSCFTAPRASYCEDSGFLSPVPPLCLVPGPPVRLPCRGFQNTPGSRGRAPRPRATPGPLGPCPPAVVQVETPGGSFFLLTSSPLHSWRVSELCHFSHPPCSPGHVGPPRPPHSPSGLPPHPLSDASGHAPVMQAAPRPSEGSPCP